VSEGLSWEAISVLTVIAGAVITVLWRHGTRLDRTAGAVERLVEKIDEDREEHAEFKEILANHDERLSNLESE